MISDDMSTTATAARRPEEETQNGVGLNNLQNKLGNLFNQAPQAVEPGVEPVDFDRFADNLTQKTQELAPAPTSITEQSFEQDLVEANNQFNQNREHKEVGGLKPAPNKTPVAPQTPKIANQPTLSPQPITPPPTAEQKQATNTGLEGKNLNFTAKIEAPAEALERTNEIARGYTSGNRQFEQAPAQIIPENRKHQRIDKINNQKEGDQQLSSPTDQKAAKEALKKGGFSAFEQMLNEMK